MNNQGLALLGLKRFDDARRILKKAAKVSPDEPFVQTNYGRALMGLGRAADARIHAPAGLELGAESPQERALAIAAELQGALREPASPAPREPAPERPQVSCASGGFATLAAS
jgi:Flp pilus assembly protein TadD